MGLAGSRDARQVSYDNGRPATLPRAAIQNFDHAALDGGDRRELVLAELFPGAAPRFERKVLLLPVRMLAGELSHQLRDAGPCGLLRAAGGSRLSRVHRRTSSRLGGSPQK